jgi:protocatechuate 4,5-dioxygenase beta chain
MYVTKEAAKNAIDRMATRAAEQGAVIPNAAVNLTVELLESNWERFRKDHNLLKERLVEYNPDAIIIIGGDHGTSYEIFGEDNKINMLIYTGQKATGINLGKTISGLSGPAHETTYVCDVDLAKMLLNELVTNERFDIAQSNELKSRRGRVGSALTTSYVNIAEIMPRPNVPTVLVYLNTFDGPISHMVSAARCYELGQAMARVLEKDSRRIAIIGSGGLSHDPFGPRNVWLDEPLDRWVLEQVAHSNCQALKDLYGFDSMTVRGGTGEIRCWLTAAGAMEYLGAKPTVVDYIPAYETVTGCGFAYWVRPATN